MYQSVATFQARMTDNIVVDCITYKTQSYHWIIAAPFCENSQIIHPEKKVANPTVTHPWMKS